MKQIKKFPGKCVYDVCFSRGRLYAAEGIDGMGIYELKGRQLEEIGRMKENCYVLHLLSDPRWLAYSSGGMNFFFAEIRRTSSGYSRISTVDSSTSTRWGMPILPDSTR